MTSKNCKLTPSPMKVGFFLSKDFTMIALASVIEVLRMANQLTGENLYKWITLSETGEPVSASDSLQINVDQSISQHQDIDLLIVCGGINIKQNSHPKILNWLCHLDRSNVQLGGICTGSYMLAKAGLLEDQPCSIHWEYLAGIQEEFPRVMSSNKLFSTSANRMTCSGGTAPMDMMLSLVTKQHGHQLSSAISEMFVCERIRNSEDIQKVPIKTLIGTSQPKLLDIVALMEANLEEIISMDDMASYVNLSRRQLERLFQKYLMCSPSRYYLNLRIIRAKQLLKHTNLSIIEISIACGFVSNPHFSKCYRDYFGLPPREERLGMSSITEHKIEPSTNEPTFASISI